MDFSPYANAKLQGTKISDFLYLEFHFSSIERKQHPFVRFPYLFVYFFSLEIYFSCIEKHGQDFLPCGDFFLYRETWTGFLPCGDFFLYRETWTGFFTLWGIFSV